MATLLLLAACGTTDADNDKNNGKNSEGSTPPAETVDDGKEEEGEEVEQPEDESKEQEGTKEEPTPEPEEPVEEGNHVDEGRPETIVLSYNDGENEKEKEAQLTKSDEQDYSVYVLPTYELTSEEPGRDSLYFGGDGSLFMRIETIVAEEDTYANALENTVALLEASSDDGTPEEITDTALFPSNEGITNPKGYSLHLDAVSLSGWVFERDGIVVKLTIFDTPQNQHYEAFLRMAETIMKTE